MAAALREAAARIVLDDGGHETVYVDTFVDGILDPNRPMLGPVRDGGHIIANTAPGCWGPMITPAIRGGHEVTQPVAVAGAEQVVYHDEARPSALVLPVVC